MHKFKPMSFELSKIYGEVILISINTTNENIKYIINIIKKCYTEVSTYWYNNKYTNLKWTWQIYSFTENLLH